MHGLQGNTLETLRLILEKQQGRPISKDEAWEVGASLISFYEVLADDWGKGNEA